MEGCVEDRVLSAVATAKHIFLIPGFRDFSGQTDLSLEELILLWSNIPRPPGVHTAMKKQSQKIKGMREQNIQAT